MLYYQKTDYDYNKSTKENYGLPVTTVQKINNTQNTVINYTKGDNNRGKNLLTNKWQQCIKGKNNI